MTYTGNKWTLAQLESEVANFMDDASYARWSQDNVDEAIRAALRAAPPKWWEERIDDSNTYSEDDFRYDLPPACVSVEEVWFEPVDSDKPRYFVEPRFWRIEGEELVFTGSYSKYDGQTMYILYVVYPINLLTESKTNGGIASTTTKDLTSSGSTFVTDGVKVGDAVVISESDYAGNGTYYVATVAEATLTLHKAPGTAGTNLDFTVALYTDLPLTYVQYYSAAYLYELAARNRPGVEVDEYLRFSTYYRQLAEQELRKQRKPRAARRRY